MSILDRLFGRAPTIERIEPALASPELAAPAVANRLSPEQAGPKLFSIARSPYGSHPAAGLTPADLAQILRSSIDTDPLRYLELAEDMEERFPQYSSTLSTRKRAVARMPVTVTPAGESKEDLAEAALVEQVLESAAFRTAKIDMLDAIGKSFSATEMIWDLSARPLAPVQFKHRDPRFFKFDRDDPERLVLRADGGQEELWPNSWIVHRAKAKSGLPIRGGLARLVAWPFLFHSFNGKDWAVFAEAFGQPLRVGKYDAGASPADVATLLEALRSVGTDYAAAIPQAMEVEFVKAEIGSSTDLYERRADWLDRQVSKIVLGQTGTTDSSEGSGYAQAKVHDGVREDIADSDAEQLAATISEQVVQPLIDLNFPARKRAGYPMVTIGRPEEEDIAALVDNVVKLVPLGLPVSIAEIQEKIGTSPPKAGEELLKPRAAPQPDPANPLPGQPGKVPPTTREKQVPAATRIDQLDAIEASIEDILGDGGWEPLLGGLVEDVRSRLLAAQSVEEARAAIAAAVEGMDVAQLTDLLANAAFSAHLAGELDEQL